MKKNRVKILLIAIIVPVLLTGCGVSPEQLAAKGIYPEEYRADSLAANIENAVLNGENKLETLYFGRISGLDPLYNEDWRRGYVCRRFVDGVSAEYEQYKGYLSAAYDIVLKDADLLAAMPRDGAALTIYRRTEDDAELCVMDMLQRDGKKALYLFESAASIEEFDKFIYDAIVGIQQKNYACEYLTDRISWVMTDYGDVTELELTVNYTEGAVPLGKMAEAVDKRSLYEAMVEAWSTDIEKEAAVLYTGASMTEGELLVTGVYESREGNTYMTHSLGTVEARTWYELSVSVPLEITEKSGGRREKTALSVDFGKKRIKLWGRGSISGASCDKITYYHPLSLPGGLRLPITMVRESVTYYDGQSVRRSREQAQKEGETLLLQQLKAQLGRDGSVTETRFSAAEEGDYLTVTLQAECLEQIGVPVQVQQTEEAN